VQQLGEVQSPVDVAGARVRHHHGVRPAWRHAAQAVRYSCDD
jgi:hypothetical protein